MKHTETDNARARKKVEIAIDKMDETIDTAALIAKAPTMYEALKRIEKITDVVLDRAGVSDGELFLANNIFSLVNSALEE